MQLQNILVVFRKEILDLIRDRRTIFATLVFPLILFPLLTAGFASISEKLIEKTKGEPQRIMLLREDQAPELSARLRSDEQFQVVPPDMNFRQQINEKKLRAAVEFPLGFEKQVRQGGQPPEIKIYYYQAEIRSEDAADRIQSIAREYLQTIVKDRLTSRGFSPALLEPVQTKQENVAPPEQIAGLRLGRLLPYFIIVLCASGALHPAIDLTAGEKERGTMETLLASAARRSELAAGKFLVVMSLSLLTTILALTSFAFSVVYFQRAGQTSGEQSFTVSWPAAALAFLLVLPVAILLSGALLALALMAKNYKEAQSYTGYVMIAVILPAIGSMIPGVEINSVTAWVPILNVSLIAQEIFTGSFPWLFIGLVFVSSCLYAALALGLAAWQFNREEVLFRE